MKDKKSSAETVQLWLGLPEPITEPGHELVMAVMFAAKMMRSTARKMLESDANLTDAQFNLMFLLKYQFEDGATQTALSQSILVNRANVTGLIDRLERDGLVERRSLKGDRRANAIFLTKAGSKRLALAEKPYLKAIEAIAAEVDESEREKTILVLQRVCGTIAGFVENNYE